MILSVDGEKVFKTEVHLNTENPEFNSKFTISLHNRLATVLRFDIMDWNQMKAHKPIANFQIPLNSRDLTILNSNWYYINQEQKGELFISLWFDPEYLVITEKQEFIMPDLIGSGTRMASGLVYNTAKIAEGGVGLTVDAISGVGMIGLDTTKVVAGLAKSVISAPFAFVGSAAKATMKMFDKKE